MKLTLALALLFAATSLSAQKSPEASTQQAFHSGGDIRMHLEAGGYTIRPSDSSNIVVTCSSESPEALRRVKTKVTVGASNADVYVRNTPDHNFTAVIEVPRQSNLWVRLTAGQLDVEAIEGNKDLEIRAGQLNVDVAHPEEYGHRDASVWSGDIEASAFTVSKGGLFRSFEQDGQGKYRLHARVLAGEIELRNLAGKSNQPPGL